MGAAVGDDVGCTTTLSLQHLTLYCAALSATHSCVCGELAAPVATMYEDDEQLSFVQTKAVSRPQPAGDASSAKPADSSASVHSRAPEARHKYSAVIQSTLSSFRQDPAES